ncbi:unnamed protein product, partial [Owenia fusiformis]
MQCDIDEWTNKHSGLMDKIIVSNNQIIPKRNMSRLKIHPKIGLNNREKLSRFKSVSLTTRTETSKTCTRPICAVSDRKELNEDLQKYGWIYPDNVRRRLNYELFDR